MGEKNWVGGLREGVNKHGLSQSVQLQYTEKALGMLSHNLATLTQINIKIV